MKRNETEETKPRGNSSGNPFNQSQWNSVNKSGVMTLKKNNSWKHFQRESSQSAIDASRFDRAKRWRQWKSSEAEPHQWPAVDLQPLQQLVDVEVDSLSRQRLQCKSRRGGTSIRLGASAIKKRRQGLGDLFLSFSFLFFLFFFGTLPFGCVCVCVCVFIYLATPRRLDGRLIIAVAFKAFSFFFFAFLWNQVYQGFYWVFLGFMGLYWVYLGLPGFYWVLFRFTGFYWVSLGFTGFYWVLMGFTEFY